jgi:hypothetical protein
MQVILMRFFCLRYKNYMVSKSNIALRINRIHSGKDARGEFEMSNTRKLLEAMGKSLTLKDVEAAVIEEILTQEIAPERRSCDHDDSFSGYVLPVSVSQFCSSVVCSFGQFGPMRIAQSDLNEGKAQFVDLDDDEMNKICALWIRYRVEMIRKG